MLDPDGLFELLGDQPVPGELGQPVLVHVLNGFVDAGQAARLAMEHLQATTTDRVLARFDIDQLLDQRSRRPSMHFADDHWESMDGQLLELTLAHDRRGTAFLLLTGPEPDMQWERFVQAVGRLMTRYGVRSGLCLQAMPMAVPHTRPIGLTAHATPPRIVAGRPTWGGRAQVPGHVCALMELRLGTEERPMAGVVVHVPHYVAQMEYPDAAVVLLEELGDLTGLSLSTEALAEAGREVRAEIDSQIAEQPEVGAVVASLERRYDTALAQRERAGVLSEGTRLPTGDELGAQIEQFLAEQSTHAGQAGDQGFESTEIAENTEGTEDTEGTENTGPTEDSGPIEDTGPTDGDRPPSG